ncbi:hypothetical protein K9L04_01635 [Patescibacteria group bacterium]|nr:hypothetical protein [Patescibacteria group bacterium]
MKIQQVKLEEPKVEDQEKTEIFNDKIILFLVIAVILIFIVNFLKKLKRKKRTEKKLKDKVKTDWMEILEISKKEGEIYKKMAIIEADKLLDNTLKRMGTPGSTMAQRLKYITQKYPKLKTVWEAHKIRNLISHESNFELYKKTSSKCMYLYEDAFKVLGIL